MFQFGTEMAADMGLRADSRPLSGSGGGEEREIKEKSGFDYPFPIMGSDPGVSLQIMEVSQKV
jgi:hypothetical protein